jgi:hypothetical protein
MFIQMDNSVVYSMFDMAQNTNTICRDLIHNSILEKDIQEQIG